MENLVKATDYWTNTANKAKAVWNWVSGKTYKELKELKASLEKKVNGLEIDVEALKIKHASTEIDLKASEIEKETIKMQLEEKKMLLVDLRLKLNQIESSSITSDIEVNQVLRLLKMKEEENEDLKKKVLNVISMLCLMSENERYQDIVKIQTNTIDEVGNENHSIYVTYEGQTVELQTQYVMEKQEVAVENTKANDKIINFNPQVMFETNNELMEQAE